MKHLVIPSLTFLAVQFSCFAADYGDAPASYGTKKEANGASHGVIPTLFMGNLGPDEEDDGIPDQAALGDDLDQVDDEDALVAASLIFLEGESDKLVVDCTNQTGRPAKLGVWVDWNRDGVFKTDPVEFAAAAVPSAGVSQQIVVTLPKVPVGVVGGNPAGELSFIRLRLSTDLAALAEPTSPAGDGEVEDWQIQIFENYDYGDLSDTGPGTGSENYRTNLADGGPRHRMGSPVYLGQRVDGEFNAQPLASALGDDNDGAVGDEDGVTVANLVPGLTATFSVSATNQTAVEAILRAEVDLNQNGSFLDPGERLSKFVPGGASDLGVQFDFEIPPGLAVGDRVASRFRISTDAMLANQAAPTTLRDGEVEDHLFTLGAGRDWGDLPDRCPGGRAGNFDRGEVLPDYRTLAIDGGPSHAITPNLTISNDLGSGDGDIDPEIDGQPDSAATGDDLDGNHDDLALLTAVTRMAFVPSALGVDHSAVELSIAVSQAVHNTTGSDATFYAFFDANRDGDFEDPGEKFSKVLPGDGSVTSVGAEFDAVVPWPGVRNWEESFALRCRISSDPGLGANGPAPDGEVQDDILNISMSIDNPRPRLVTPDIEGAELIQLTGPDVTVPLGVPFSPQSSQVRPEGIENIQNPRWSLLLNGEIAAGGALNLDATAINNLGVGSHPVTHSFEDAATGDFYVIRFFLKIVDLPGYADWASNSNLPASVNRPGQDPDEDGLPNLVEFALGSRPDLTGEIPRTSLSVVGAGYLTMSYARLSGGTPTVDGYRVGDLLYRGQGSLDLVDWAAPVVTTSNPPALPALPAGYAWGSFRLNEAMEVSEQGFLRTAIQIRCVEHR